MKAREASPAFLIGDHHTEAQMRTIRFMGLSILAAVAAAAVANNDIRAENEQTLAEQIVEARALTAVTFQYHDGTSVNPYGPNVKGSLTIDGNGRFSLSIIGVQQPKFAPNNRFQGTPEENAAVIRATEIFFGTSLDETEKTITFHLERAIFPNWDGTDRKFTIAFKGKQLEMVGPPTPGPNGIFNPHVVWN